MSGENHSEKLHRDEHDREFRPELAAGLGQQQQKQLDAQHEHEHAEQDQAAAKRMQRVATRPGTKATPRSDAQRTEQQKAAELQAEAKRKADAEAKRKQEEALQEAARKAAIESRAQGAVNALVLAMDRWGTDETLILTTLRHRDADEIKAIKDAYLKRTGRTLEADLTSELDGNDLKEAKSLLSRDPVQMRVAALQNAMEGWGTDVKKVQQTLRSITDPAMKAQVVAEYEKQTGQKLDKMLASEGLAKDGIDPSSFRAAKPAEPTSAEKARIDQLANTKDSKLAASAILGATDRWGTDETALFAALKGKNPQEIAAIKQAFREHSGKDLVEVLESELSGTALKEAKALLTADPVQTAVAQLQNAATGVGTDVEKIHATLKDITDPAIRAQVIAEYEKHTGQKVDDMILSETSGFERDKALAYAEGNKAKTAAVEADAAMHGGFFTNLADGVADSMGIDRQVVRGAVSGTVLGPAGTIMMLRRPSTDFGTDNKALYAALESCKDQQERDALAAAYKERTKRDLMTDLLLDVEGKEKDVIRFLMTGDQVSANAAKLAAAAEGMGTDKAALYEILEKAANQEARNAIIAKYNELYGKDGHTFEKMLEAELGTLDREKARQLATQGKMTDAFALYYAMSGIGTDDELLKSKLAGRSKEQIEQLKREYAEVALQFGRRQDADLIADVDAETSGRVGHETTQALKGTPTTLEEMRQRLAEDYAFERTESGWIGDAAMFVMNPIGFHAAKASGFDSTDIANGLTDVWSGSGARLDKTHADIEARYAQIKADPRFATYDQLPRGSAERAAMDRQMMAELQGVADWQAGDLKAFQEAKDATADVASTAVTIAVGAVITIASGGAAAPAVVALFSGLAGVSTQMLIKGGSMSNEELLQATASVIAEAAAAGIVKIEKINKLCEWVGQLTGGDHRLLAKIVGEAVEEALESGSEELINALLDPALYNGDLADWMTGVTQRTGKAMFTGAFAGGVAAGVGDLMPKTTTWYGRAAASATSQASGAVATAAISPSTYEGSQEEKLMRFGRSVGEAALRGARDSLGGGQGDSLGDDHFNVTHTRPKPRSSSTATTSLDTSADTSSASTSEVTTQVTPPPVTAPEVVTPTGATSTTAVTTPTEVSTTAPTVTASQVELQASQTVTSPIVVSDQTWTMEDELAAAIQRERVKEAREQQTQAVADEATSLEQAALNAQDEATKLQLEDRARQAAWAAYEAQRARIAAEVQAKRDAMEAEEWDAYVRSLEEAAGDGRELEWLEAARAVSGRSKPPGRTLVGDTSFKADRNNDGVQDAARVGVDGTSIPNQIPRLPGLDAEQQAAETRFATAYERDPEGLAREYLAMVMSGQTDKEMKNFATDDAKLLSPDYNNIDQSPIQAGEVDPKLAARGMMNIAVHQTANAVAKLAFTMRLDQIANDPALPKKILVTAGGVGAGKSYAIDNNPQAALLKQQSAAVWDSAGEQNSTELPWVIQEARQRGIEVSIVYVHRRPEQSWENMKYGVIPRAAKSGRMVDARLHADSYAEGARNFDAVHQQMMGQAGVTFVVIDATEEVPVEIDQLPKDALELDADQVHARNVAFLETQQANLPDYVVQGGNTIGEKIWGPAADLAPPVATQTETTPAAKPETPALDVVSEGDLEQLAKRTRTKGSELAQRHILVGKRMADLSTVQGVLGRVVAGDLSALSELGVTGRAQHVVPDRVEWAVGKIQTATGPEYVLVKGDSLTVDISDLPGVQLVAHNHPRNSDMQLAPTAKGSMHVADLLATQHGSNALFPSAHDLAYAAEHGQESHTIFLPYRHMGGGNLENSDAPGAESGAPVEVRFLGARAVPGSDPERLVAEVEWYAGGALLHRETLITAQVANSSLVRYAEESSEAPMSFDERSETSEATSSETSSESSSSESSLASSTTTGGGGSGGGPPPPNPPRPPKNKKKRRVRNAQEGDSKDVQEEALWQRHADKITYKKRKQEAKRKFEEAKVYERYEREVAENRKKAIDKAWEEWESRRREAPSPEQETGEGDQQIDATSAQVNAPLELPGIEPGTMPEYLSEEHTAAFAEANAVYASLANGFHGPDFAKIQWSRILARHGIKVDGAPAFRGRRVRADKNEKFTGGESKVAHNIAEHTVTGETSLGQRTSKEPLSMATVEAALREIEDTLVGVHIRTVKGSAVIIQVIDANGLRVDHVIRFRMPDYLAPGTFAGHRFGDSPDETFAWVSKDLTDDQVVRAVGGVIAQIATKASGGKDIAMDLAAQRGQLDALLGHLDRVTKLGKNQQAPAAGNKIEQAIALSKQEDPDRIKSEIDLQLGRMGLVPSHPLFESQLATLPDELAKRVRAHIKSRSLSVNTSAVYDQVSVTPKAETVDGTMGESSVLSGTPDAKSIKPYTAADQITAIELRAVFDGITELDQRISQRDQKGTHGDRGEIAQGETLRRRELVARAQELMGKLQLGGTDLDYYVARLEELEAVFPGLGKAITPHVMDRVLDRLESEAAHKVAQEYQQKAIEQAAKIEEMIKSSPDPFIADRMVIGDGPAGLANLATLGQTVGEDGFLDPKQCIVLGGTDLLTRMAKADPKMRWGQRAGLFDREDGKSHAIFAKQDGTGTGELRQTSEDEGDFASVGAMSDALDLARKRLGVARVPAKVIKVEVRPPEGWPGEASGVDRPCRVLVEFADKTTKYVYLNHADITIGVGQAQGLDESILSSADKQQLVESKAIMGGEEVMTGKHLRGKRVLVVGYGPTGAWASVQAAKQGAALVDWTGSNGKLGANEAELAGLRGIDRVQEAFETTSRVNTSTDRVISIIPEGGGALVTFVRGKPPNEQTYTVHYDVVVSAILPSNTSNNTVSQGGLANTGTMLEGVTMRAQGVREDGSVAPVMESTEGGEHDGSVRVLGAAAWDNLDLEDELDAGELKQRRNDIKKRLSADSPDARVMEATSEIAENANKPKMK